ncbi:EAL domain-containing protein [Pseudoxanthobacter sp.]|uniref:EAL domain-containing protein n=1 Tax=Pseudoxanthobacter sp. TaxID=1925742 RepID=UPI002FE046A8
MLRTRRFHIIAVAVLLGILGAALPLAATAWIARYRALQDELGDLQQTAHNVLLRARRTAAQVDDTLKTIAASHLTPCSQPHIEEMRRLTAAAISVEEIGYFQGGFLKCTSWGPTRVIVPREAPAYVLPDGLGVTLDVEPRVSARTTMAAFDLGDYNALVVPARFVDVLLDDGMAVALATEDGRAFATVDPAALPPLTLLRGGNREGMAAGKLFVVRRDAGLIVLVSEPAAELSNRVDRLLLLLLPVGGFIAVFIVVVVVWLSRKRLSPRAELEIAVRKDEFVVCYQPLIALASGRCVGAEALVRWRRPDGSMVRPDLFIPLAEETGLILPITDRVIGHVMHDMRDVLRSDPSLHIAINICADDMRTGRVLDVLGPQLRAAGLGAGQIWLEATERGFIDIHEARATLERAREAGYTIAIDDFGTGYSSLQYLHGLPVDGLKIDKSFVETIDRETATSAVTAHIIDMAKSLGLFLVAEGVETERQAAYLRDNGVAFAQGWLFARPLPAAEFSAFVRETNGPPGTGSAPAGAAGA